MVRNLWKMRDINVCFDGGFFSQSGKGAIQAVLRGQRSWANSADINFVGWQDCTTNSWGVRIEAADLLPPPIPPLSFVLALGPEPSGVSRMTLRFDTEDCDFLQSGVECAGDVGLHEFGHSLGLAHEQLRPGGLCVVGFGGPGDDVIGAYNGASIMEQCGQPSELSQMDRVGIGYLYGARYRFATASTNASSSAISMAIAGTISCVTTSSLGNIGFSVPKSKTRTSFRRMTSRSAIASV